MFWFEQYINRPWAEIPNPPESFTCGELVRFILHQHCGLEIPPIIANAASRKDSVRAMQDVGRYDLVLLPEYGKRQEFDVVYFVRAVKRDHVGIAVQGREGLKILHCQQGVGVTVDTPGELKGLGVRRLEWFRHKTLV